MTSRREVMLSVGALALSGCATPCPPPPIPQFDPKLALLDGHCHLFNRQDLSAVRFLSVVMAKQYPDVEKELRALAPDFVPPVAPEDPTLLDLVFGLILHLVGADSAPSAAKELAVLRGRALRDAADVSLDQKREAAAGRIADFLGEHGLHAERPEAGVLQSLILQSARGEFDARKSASLSRADRLTIARQLVDPETETKSAADEIKDLYLPGLFNFALQLTRYRHCVADELTALHEGAGQRPLLFAPAMVDFGRWLRDEPQRGSSFAEQVDVWAEIGRRKGGPAIHGYVAFCPLRQVEFERERFGPGKIATPCDRNPLEVVEIALRDKGFLGVKMYPPMGFAAANNERLAREGLRFPVEVLDDVFEEGSKALLGPRSVQLGALLDEALDRLYELCREYGAPIMAHGGNSIEANNDTGELADPYRWLDVIENGKAPAVMVAHMGGFDYWTNDPTVPRLPSKCPPEKKDCVPLEMTWEAWLARYVQQTGGAKPIYGDISMFTEALKTDRAQRSIENFRALDGSYPKFKDHLVFGTDWLMLAQKKDAEDYSRLVRQALVAAFGEPGAERIMRVNFATFAGLSRSTTFDRLSKPYAGDPQLLGRLRRAIPV